jgi:hypothetical protein
MVSRRGVAVIFACGLATLGLLGCAGASEPQPSREETARSSSALIGVRCSSYADCGDQEICGSDGTCKLAPQPEPPPAPAIPGSPNGIASIGEPAPPPPPPLPGSPNGLVPNSGGAPSQPPIGPGPGGSAQGSGGGEPK